DRLAEQGGLHRPERLQGEVRNVEAAEPHRLPPKRSAPGGGSLSTKGRCEGARKERSTSSGARPSLLRARRQRSSTPSKSRPGPRPEKRAFARSGTREAAAAKPCAPAAPTTSKQLRCASAP